MAVAARKYCCWRAPQAKPRPRLFGLYTAHDMRFATYHTLLLTAIYLAAVFSGCTGRVGRKSGLNFEIWVAVFFEAVFTTSIRAFLTASPMSPSKVFLAVVPFSARFDLLRDATLVGAFVQVGSTWTILGASGIICSTLLASLVSYGDRADCLDVRRCFWAEGERPPPRLEDTLDKDLLRSLQGEDEQTESSNCIYVEVRNDSSEDETLPADSPTLTADVEHSETTQALLQRLLVFMAESTSHAKQLKGIHEQIPQATIGTAVSLTMKAPSLLVFLCVLTTWLQAATIYMVRPFVLCMQAAKGLAWVNACLWDFSRARACCWWRPALGSAAFACVALDEESSLELRSGAAAALCEEVEAEQSQSLKDLEAAVFKRLVAQEGSEAIIEALAQGPISDDPELSVAPGIAKKWRLLAAILARTSQANVNFMQITPEILEKELLPRLEKERYLPLKYVNLNDNKELCKTKEGIDQVLELLKRCPKLERLRLQRTGISEYAEGKARLQQAWGPQREAKLLELDEARK
ncbi:unnamed protein product [Symbiodinium sp. CCMP2456]|nr:unnamed protein product [Symbiodinium sp. CCMP2456]